MAIIVISIWSFKTNLERLGLAEKSHTEVRHLSRGMQQKLSLGVALMHDPTLLLLDEPTLGLDVESALRVEEMVRELAGEGRAILLTTHQLEVAQRLAARLVILQAGRIVLEGQTGTVLQRFSGEHYTIELETPLSPDQLAALRPLGLEGPEYIFQGDPAGLWQVLEALKPLPLKKVARAETNLLEVFLKVVGRARFVLGRVHTRLAQPAPLPQRVRRGRGELEYPLPALISGGQVSGRAGR